MAKPQQQPAGCAGYAGAALFVSLCSFFLSTCFGEPKDTPAPYVISNTIPQPSDEEIREMGRQWAREDEAWQPPTGFSLTDVATDREGDALKAWVRWLDTNEFDCSVGDKCWGAEVIAMQYCDSIYAEASLLNSKGTNIGMSNDTSSSVAAKKKVRFVFETFENGAKSIELTKIRCL